ncbi:MAG: hypothetical protein LBQ83_04920 [Candidatus Margulisbacteria bacterium]|jgi:V/A-type H+-transporting ATPase subunit I|nr:hypothetical protein [Candidatus Margulisiibacteriota bacterium]
MAVARMQKLQIFILQKRTREFLAGLQKLACFELSNTSAVAVPDRALRYQKAVDFLAALFPRPRGFIENFIQIKPVIKEAQAGMIMQKEPLLILRQLEKLQADWEAQAGLARQLQEEIARQDLYAAYGLRRARQAAKLKRVKVIFGQVPRKALAAEMPPLAQDHRKDDGDAGAGAGYFIQVVQTTENTACLQLLCLREDEAALRDSLPGLGFQEISLPLQAREYRQESLRLGRELKKTRDRQAKLKNKLRSIQAAEYAKLAVWADYLANAEQVDAYTRESSATAQTSLLTGWVPVAQKKQVLDYLEKFSDALYWREVEPDAGETPPTVLQNNLTAPLETVTALYGLPHNREFDPSPLMAPFFIVFYGLCLSDAGYGLMLLLLAGFLLWKFRVNLTRFGRKLLVLNMYCGVSTIVVGLLTGSIWGLNFELLPWPALKNFLLALKVIDPLNNPLPLLGLAVGLGMAQMLTGLTIRYILDIRELGGWPAFLKSGCWLVFLASIFSYAGAAILGWAAAARWLGYLTGLGVVFMVLTQGRHQKNPLLKLGSGLLSLYSLSGYVGDLLSYTRLFALGLVTAVMALVVNYLAALPGGLAPLGIPVGAVLMVIILIFGHTFDFLINMLGSFVHAARLQYVEYFSKFFEGGGRFFRPFSWQAKYVSLDK